MHRRKEIRKMNEGNKLKDKKYCSRGLEGFTTVGAATKYIVRDRWPPTPFSMSIFDEDAIAEIYCKAISSCQLWATSVGRRDHRETEPYVRA
jgi:hypothetical protein